MTHSKIKERVALSNLDDGFWSNTSHTSAETAIELEYDKFVEEGSTLSLANVVIVDDLLRLWRLDTIPITIISRQNGTTEVHFISLCLVAEIAGEQAKKVVHFNSEFLVVSSVTESGGDTSLASGGAVSTNFFNSFLIVVAARLLLVLS